MIRARLAALAALLFTCFPALAQRGLSGVAQAGSTPPPAAPRPYRPFIDPLQLHDGDLWWWTIVPLALGVSMAYKAVRMRRLGRYWRQVLVMTLQVICAMIGLGAIIYSIVEFIVPAMG